MSGLVLEQAVKSQRKARAAFIGPSGSGKTFSALRFAQAFGQKVIVIDTENGSASLYSDLFSFKRINLTSFSPQMYREAIALAEKDGPDVIIVDSISHAWAGKDGVLELVDKVTARSGSKNKFTAWREATPEHNAFVKALVYCRAHLIVTVRSKVEYVLEEDDRGKKVPVKKGMAPIQREGLEYEFDLVIDMDQEHKGVVTKTRCAALDGGVWSKPGEAQGQTFRAWLDGGAPVVETPKPATPPAAAKPATNGNGGAATTPPPTTREDGTPYLPTDDDNALVVVAERLDTLNHPKAIDSWLKKHFKADVEPRGEVFVANVKDLVGKRRAELAEALAPKDDAPPPEEP